MKKVIGYVRVSSLIQKEKGNSIPNQISKIKSYCKLNEYELIDILSDDGISGMSKSKRKDYLKLIDIISNKDIDGVVVNDLSRIGRKMSDVVEFIDSMKKKNIEFHYEDLINEPVSLREIACIRRSDLSIIISKVEIQILQDIFKVHPSKIHYTPLLI